MKTTKDIQEMKLNSNLIKTANRVYDFFQMVGEEYLDKVPKITASKLARINQSDFDDLKHSIFLNMSLGGTQE